MFYRPGTDAHGLPHNPLKAIIAPRPIAWISTRSSDGVDNLSPYSFFNGIADDPPMLMFATTGKKLKRDEQKDSITNIRETGVFATNVVPYDMRFAMNVSTKHYDAAVDEFAEAEIEKAECDVINAPRVALSPASLECRAYDIIDLPGEANFMVIAHIVGIHIRDEYLQDGVFDVTRFKPMARLGYRDYTAVTEVFSIKRPDQT